MVPPLTRRRVLAGGVGLGSVALGASVLPASALPDRLVDYRTGRVGVPRPEWHPPVADAHVAAAVERLRAAVERAERAWKPVDRSSTPREFFYDEHTLKNAQDALAEAEDAPATREALSTVLRGAREAGYAVGGARVLRDAADPEGLVERGRRLRESIAETRETVRYVAAEPTRGLGFLYHAERHLALAGLNSHADGTYAGGERAAEDYSDHTVASTWASHFEAEQFRLNGEWYYRAYGNGLDGPDAAETIDLADAVTGALDAFARELDAAHPPRDVYDRIEALPAGPYRTTRFHLWHRAASEGHFPDDEGPWAGLAVYRLVEAARTVLRVRAAEEARAELALDPRGALDAAVVYRTKRRAARLFRRRRRELGDGPLATLLLAEPANLVRYADVDPGEERPRWEARAVAYAEALVALGELRHVAAVYGRLAGPKLLGDPRVR